MADEGCRVGRIRGPEPSAGVAGRLVIDARGSIDSRTFDTEGWVSPVVKDACDRHDPIVDLSAAQAHWQSRAGQGFADAPASRIVYVPKRRQGSAKPRISPATRRKVSSSMLSGRRDLWQPQQPFPTVPLFFKVVIPLIAVLLVIVVYLALA